MTDKNVWFVTGAGRGMGVDIAKAALAAGHAVVATGRNTNVVAKALGAADDLLIVKLDVTRPEDAKAAVAAGVERFGRIDVSVNNAGNFYAGFFEEISPVDKVRRGGVDGIAGRGDRAVRHPHDACRARLLPHRVAHRPIDGVARSFDRRLRRKDP